MAMTTPGPEEPKKTVKDYFEEGVKVVIDQLIKDMGYTFEQAEALVYTQIIVDLKDAR